MGRGCGAPCAGEKFMKENIITGWRAGRYATAAWTGLPAAIFPANAGEPGERGRPAVTLYELSLEYRQTAEALRERVRELESRRELEEDDEQQRLLDYRLRLLRSMWRDTRAVSVHLEHYYERGVSRNAHYVI